MTLKELPPKRTLRILGVALVSMAAVSWLMAKSLQSEPAAPDTAVAQPAPPRHAVIINQPDTEPVIDSGKTDEQGRPLYVSCGTCHDTRTADVSINSAGQLKEFHQGLIYTHGELSCLSCHNADDYTTLRLANGTAMDFRDSMQLCGQCHGPQFRDYQNGAHGGMTGYWDLGKGPRHRNHCLDCHDAHSPAYPQVYPVFAPKDLKRSESKHE